MLMVIAHRYRPKRRVVFDSDAFAKFFTIGRELTALNAPKRLRDVGSRVQEILKTIECCVGVKVLNASVHLDSSHSHKLTLQQNLSLKHSQ